MFAPTPDEPDERSWLRAGRRARNGIDGSVGRWEALTFDHIWLLTLSGDEF